MKKYELLPGEKIKWFGITLYRIKACIDFVTTSGIEVNVGDLGGFIEKESNLSQDGTAWIFNYAKVCENAKVYGNAEVHDYAKVYGNAEVSDRAKVCDNAKIYGSAKVYGNAEVSFFAEVCENAEVSDLAKVYGNANVYGSAKVYDSAKVYGLAKVYDSSEVYCFAEVCGCAKVYGSTKVCGDSKVCGVSKTIEKKKLISECCDFGIKYEPNNPLCQIFESITKKTSYNSFKIWALKIPTDNPALQDCERDTALRISDLSPDVLKREYLRFNQVYWLSGENMTCDDPNFTFATIHTPAMEKLNNSLPTCKDANRRYDFDDFGQEYNHYLDFKDTLRRAEKYGVDTSEFKEFVAKTYPRALTSETQKPKHETI